MPRRGEEGGSSGSASGRGGGGGGGGGGGAYPSSPGRGDDWIASLEGPGSSTAEGGGAAEASGSSQPALPASAREAFHRAEALCEQQRFGEAVPLFQHVLQVLASAVS